jgi:hypothetical protein
MKRLIIIFVLLVGVTAIGEAKSQSHINSYGYFYSHLSPHGVWMEFGDGLVVWRPTIMRRGWAPYSFGRWIWTDYGWYWDSDESFGYITYHYGRWFYDDYYGWVWAPDYDWAPSWVEWRYDDSYIGWAPLPPYAVFSINIGIHFTFNYVTPYNHWHFVNYNYMCDPYVYNHYLGAKHKYKVFSNTKYRNDYGYSNGRIINRGVDVGQVRSRSGQDIRQRNLQQVSDPRELTRTDKDRNLDRKNDDIRTFIPSHEEVTKDNVRDSDVRKIERRSSLETSKLQIGDRRTNREDTDIKARTDDSRNVIKERSMKDQQVEEKQRTQERMDVERKREESKVKIERQRKDVPTSENQNKRIDVDKSRTNRNEVRQERNTQIQREQTEVKVERKIETNKQENHISKQNVERKTNDSRNSGQRTDQDTRTKERTRTR